VVRISAKSKRNVLKGNYIYNYVVQSMFDIRHLIYKYNGPYGGYNYGVDRLASWLATD